MQSVLVMMDEDTHRRLREASAELGRSVEDLAECAVAEEALRWDKGRGGRRIMADSGQMPDWRDRVRADDRRVKGWPGEPALVPSCWTPGR